jgi:hypothetical protein
MLTLAGAPGATLAGKTFASAAKKALIRLRGGSFTRNIEVSGNSISNRVATDNRFIDYQEPLESGSVFNPRSGEWEFGEDTNNAMLTLFGKDNKR